MLARIVTEREETYDVEFEGKFEAFVAKVKKHGITVRELIDGRSPRLRHIPGRTIYTVLMDQLQEAPAKLTYDHEVRVVIIKRALGFVAHPDISGMYLNGLRVPGHVAEWRILTDALKKLGKVSVVKEEFVTTVAVSNAPPTYDEVKKIGQSQNYEILFDSVPE